MKSIYSRLGAIASLLALEVLLAAGAVAQTPPNPVQANGGTITLTANVSGSIPSPVQAPSAQGTTQQYLVTNIGGNVAFISVGSTAAIATARCVVPPAQSYPVLAVSQIVITDIPNGYFCGITSAGTSIIYITPVIGN